MKTYRFLHTADWHSDGDSKKQAKLKASLDQILDYVQQNEVEAIIHAGDIWEKKQSYADNSGVPMVIDYLRKLSKHVKFIFITKGNNSHDEPGSISLLHQLEPNIYAYEYPVVLAVHSEHMRGVEDILRNESFHKESVCYIVSLVPYPTKAMFLSDDSIDNNNADFIQKFEGIFELIGDVTEDYNCPKILGFHGNVVGSRLSSGQSLVSQDIMVAPSTLQKAKADYYALGHIHLHQEVAPFMYYSGSIYNKNWGETEQKSFEVIEFILYKQSRAEIETKQVTLSSARPMIKIDAIFQPNSETTDFIFQPELLSEDADNSEIRFRITVKENERNLLTDDKIEWIKNYCKGSDVKIEFNIVPVERESRSEQIMHCKGLKDEVTEYASVINADVFSTGTEENFLVPSLIEKITRLQEEVIS